MKRISGTFLAFALTTFLILTSASIGCAAEQGPYFGIFGGYVMPDDLELSGAASADVKLKNSWGVGAKVGYIFPAVKWLAAELDYSYLAKQDIDEDGVDGDFKAHNLMANLIARYPEGKIHPYIGAGAGCSWGSFKATGLGTSVDESDNAFAWQLLAGVNFDIAPRWSVDLGYRYIQSKYDLNSGLGDFDAKSKNHMITIGFTYYFGAVAPAAAPVVPQPVVEPAPAPAPAPEKPALSAPINLKATPASDSQINVTWDAVEGAAGYKIYRDDVFLTKASSPSLEDAGLKPSTKYCYCVTAVNEDGKETVKSKTECATTPAAPTPVAKELIEKGRATIDIKFDFDKADVKKQYHDELAKFAIVLKEHPDLKLIIEGHTDNIGGKTYNEKLSQRRAEAVKDYLVKNFSIDASRLTAKGYGMTKPISDNKTKEGRQKNRRVEAVVDYTTKKIVQ